MQPGKYDEGPHLISQQNCSELYSKFGSLNFKIWHTEFKIHPRGYLYEISGEIDRCHVGIEAIEDGIDEYRLG